MNSQSSPNTVLINCLSAETELATFLFLLKFVENYDPAKNYLWIVETGPIFSGSIAIAKVNDKTAQLRWLFVEPQARNKGIGTKLMHEALNFCKYRGYQKVILGTISDLTIARNLYSKNGFQLIQSKKHRIWGRNLTKEKWELTL